MKKVNTVKSNIFVNRLGLLKSKNIVTIGKIQRKRVSFAAIPRPATIAAVVSK